MGKYTEPEGLKLAFKNLKDADDTYRFYLRLREKILLIGLGIIYKICDFRNETTRNR